MFCNLAPEDAFHFIAQCPALSPARDAFDLPTPLASARDSDPAHFSALILGTEWFDETLPYNTRVLSTFITFCQPTLFYSPRLLPTPRATLRGGYKEEEEVLPEHAHNCETPSGNAMKRRRVHKASVRGSETSQKTLQARDG